MSPEDIENRFAFHASPHEGIRRAHASVRAHCKDLAVFLDALLPDGREKAVTITKLEEVMFWGNAALAREREPQEPPRGYQE